MARPTLSVIITNYNYAKFLSVAIESLRNQTVPIEIVIVDDCSTDESREVLANCHPTIKAILKDKNLGHGDGFNKGFAASTGDIVLFLDADDFMLPGAAQALIETFDGESGLNVYRMRYADADGRIYGLFPPLEAPLTHGSASDVVLQQGTIQTTVTSGMVYPRWVLDLVLPVPADQFRQGADGYLASVVPLYGNIRVHDIPITAYRQHRTQHSKFLREYAKRARWCIDHNHARYSAIQAHAEKLNKAARADLASADVNNIQQRLISLLFEPDLHPIVADKLEDLTQRIIELQSDAPPSLARTLRIFWWRLLGSVGTNTRRTLISWQVDPLTRPVWLSVLGRILRTRLKVTA
jgi:glycosyltransferase involved in cell wall biosynthesis